MKLLPIIARRDLPFIIAAGLLALFAPQAEADCEAIAQYKELKSYRQPMSYVQQPSTLFGAPAGAITRETSRSGITQFKVQPGESIIRWDPKSSSIEGYVPGQVLRFTLNTPLTTYSDVSLARPLLPLATFDLVNGGGSFAVFRLPFMHSTDSRRSFLVDENGAICHHYIEDDNWSVRKDGIRTVSAPQMQIRRSEIRHSSQVLLLARIGTTVDVEWREVANDGTSTLKSQRSLDREARSPVAIGPFEILLNDVDATSITLAHATLRGRQ